MFTESETMFRMLQRSKFPVAIPCYIQDADSSELVLLIRKSRQRKRQTTFHKAVPLGSIVDDDYNVGDRDGDASGDGGPASADDSSELEEVHG